MRTSRKKACSGLSFRMLESDHVCRLIFLPTAPLWTRLNIDIITALPPPQVLFPSHTTSAPRPLNMIMRISLATVAAAAYLFGAASAYSPSSTVPQLQLQRQKAARRALFGSGPRSSSTPLKAAAAAIYHSPGESEDDVDKKPFKPGPYITFGSSGLKLNWFGAIYGSVAIGLGLIWYASLCACQLMYLVSRGKIDKYRRVPITFSQIWGATLMRLMGCSPKVTGLDNLKKLDKNSGPVMFVANHCSWMDIPFVGVNVGWRNYKIIAKNELLKVPILSKSLVVAGHIMLDRSSRRSQLNTYKKGVQYLKDGVDLVTFPEGTRSRDGRLGPFKKGAFKMAEAVDAPIVPMTIGYAHKVQPLDYIFPVRRSRCIPATIHIGEPIDTIGKSDEEVMDTVWDTIAEQLPESQKPKVGTPKAVN